MCAAFMRINIPVYTVHALDAACRLAAYILQSENLTSNALTLNTRTRLAVIDNLYRGRRAVFLQTITTRHSNRKQTTDRQTTDGTAIA